MSASSDPKRGWGRCVQTVDPCTTLTRTRGALRRHADNSGMPGTNDGRTAARSAKVRSNGKQLALGSGITANSASTPRQPLASGKSFCSSLLRVCLPLSAQQVPVSQGDAVCSAVFERFRWWLGAWTPGRGSLPAPLRYGLSALWRGRPFSYADDDKPNLPADMLPLVRQRTPPGPYWRLSHRRDRRHGGL
jgi:hypothetical protein